METRTQQHIAALAGLCLIAHIGTAACQTLHRYWPRFPRPKALVLVPFVGDHEEGMTFETAAGLAARAVFGGRSGTMLYEDIAGSAYLRWSAAMTEVVRPQVEGPLDVWGAVRRLQSQGIVRGYILYRYDVNERPFHAEGALDESANVATSLASVLGGVAVSERLEPKAKETGLPLLLDVRDKTEAWCLDTHSDRFSRKLIMTADPKSRVARSMAVALNAFVVSQPGEVYERALAHCEPDCPVLGWGCGGEDRQTMPSSQWGLFQTATNWCHNLPALSTEQVGETIPRDAIRLPSRCAASLRDLKWEEGVHYVAFLMSDGDNVQWLMGNFAGGSEGRWYYESPARGEFPFGWTFPYANLAQLCPYTLVDLFERATPNDDFVPYGNGYLYPDHFGEKRQTKPGQPDPFTLHARRLGEYMRFGGLHTVAYNTQDWDSPAAQSAYATLAREVPDLDGIFTVQYYPYSGGEGRILWAEANGRSVPVISCRLCLWANTGRPRDTTPTGVAKWLNNMPRGGDPWTDRNFSFVMPHCWSRFHNTNGDASTTAEDGADQGKDAPGTARGLMPVKWTVDRLDDHVRVVKPSELALLVKLHLRTRETLESYLARLRPLSETSASRRAKDLLAQATKLLPTVRDGDGSGRECFRLLQEAERECDTVGRRGAAHAPRHRRVRQATGSRL